MKKISITLLALPLTGSFAFAGGNGDPRSPLRCVYAAQSRRGMRAARDNKSKK